MLPTDELVRHSITWHEFNNGELPRPEDVVVSAFVQLREITVSIPPLHWAGDDACSDVGSKAETTGLFHSFDVNYDVVLHSCNNKLTEWMQHWGKEMNRGKVHSYFPKKPDLFKLC